MAFSYHNEKAVTKLQWALGSVCLSRADAMVKPLKKKNALLMLECPVASK